MFFRFVRPRVFYGLLYLYEACPFSPEAEYEFFYLGAPEPPSEPVGAMFGCLNGWILLVGLCKRVHCVLKGCKLIQNKTEEIEHYCVA